LRGKEEDPFSRFAFLVSLYPNPVVQAKKERQFLAVKETNSNSDQQDQEKKERPVETCSLLLSFLSNFLEIRVTTIFASSEKKERESPASSTC